MIPIRREDIPAGSDWGYQLKWDGVRILAAVGTGGVELYSRKLRKKTAVYPEIADLLGGLRTPCILDGEMVVFDPESQKPEFHKILQRERTRKLTETTRQRYPVMFVLFDLLSCNGQDMKAWPLAERFDKLKKLFPEPKPQLLVTDMYDTYSKLWEWVTAHSWEGIVSKRLSSQYREGKHHQDWFKKKNSVRMDVHIAGVTVRSGQPASLVMAREGQYLGKVALGLNQELKERIINFARQAQSATPAFRELPADLKKERILWLKQPLCCTVSALEITPYGVLRHPKIEVLLFPDEV
jgi:bifunctional non-homologous end joining protein LigD